MCKVLQNKFPRLDFSVPSVVGILAAWKGTIKLFIRMLWMKMLNGVTWKVHPHVTNSIFASFLIKIHISCSRILYTNHTNESYLLTKSESIFKMSNSSQQWSGWNKLVKTLSSPNYLLKNESEIYIPKQRRNIQLFVNRQAAKSNVIITKSLEFLYRQFESWFWHLIYTIFRS